MFEEVLFPVKIEPIKRNGNITKRNRIIRSDTGEIISIVSNQYTLIPNSLIDNVIKNMFNVNITRGYSNGFFSRFEYHIDAVKKEVSKNDIVQMVISVENSYDCSRKLKISLDALRLACMNGMLIGESVYESQYIHKSRNAESIIEEIKNNVYNSSELFKNVVDKLKKMKETKLNDELRFNIVKSLSNFPKYINEPILLSLMENNNENLYDVYNVITYFTTHKLKISNVSRFNIINDLNKAIINLN